MGSVYRARELSSGRALALKVLNAEGASAATRFLREGQVTAALHHEGIVRIHSIGTLRGRPCLAYELVEGARSFDEAIDAEPALALPLLSQAARALGAAHEAGLVHRDVKSENLLVDSAGRLRVTDFGLVTGEELSRLTLSGAWVGTPMTMAPEQFGAREAVGPATDVWALGVLLYRSLAGVYPFAGAGSMIELASAITAGDFVRPSRVRPSSPTLEAVCLKAMSECPQDRYANGIAFAEALEVTPLKGSGSARPPLLVGSLLLAVLVAGGAFLLRGETAPPDSIRPDGTPRIALGETPSASPSAPPTVPDPLAAIRDWRQRAPARVPEAILKRDYPGVEDGFRFMLSALDQNMGSTTEVRVARALLTGTGVRRDVEGALAILRHTASGGNRAAQALLIETLAKHGHDEEELVWIGRLAIRTPHPFELHRLWKIAGSEDERAPLARRIWAEIPPAHLRWAMLDLWEGRRAKPADDAAARGQERTRFWVEVLLQGWRGEEGLTSDWQLGATLDCLPPPLRKRWVSDASPSRRLARLLLRREGKAPDPSSEELALLERAIGPTLRGADEGWLLEVVEALAAGKARPPCLEGFVTQLRTHSSPAAKRWTAFCEAAGIGAPKSPRGLAALKRLHRGGDHQAGVLIVQGGPKTRLTEARRVLEPGIRAGHPETLFLVARARLGQANLSDVERAGCIEQLERAAAGGDQRAQALLARLVRLTASQPEDLTRSYELMKVAADSGLPLALSRLAVFEDAGFGCQQDRAAARRHMRRAARLGDPEAALRLGVWLQAIPPGEGGGEAEILHRAQARRYLRRAVLWGLGGRAEVALAKLNLRDEWRKKAAVLELVRQAKAAPEGAAALELAKIRCSNGKAEGEAALRRLASKQNSALAAYLKHLKGLGRDAEGQAFLQQGAEQGIPQFLIRAAQERFPRDQRWAEQALLRVARQGRPQALVILGQCLWDLATPQARAQAWGVWLKAQAMGSDAALIKLGRHPWPTGAGPR